VFFCVQVLNLDISVFFSSITEAAGHASASLESIKDVLIYFHYIGSSVCPIINQSTTQEEYLFSLLLEKNLLEIPASYRHPIPTCF
jgi:hypothetical protein